MKDLTRGPIAGHVVSMAIPMGAGMVFQTLYYFVDLYFVAKLGDAAVAGVSAAGNVMFIVLALTQVLGVGTVALISHAVGRKDQGDANLIFNQSLVIAFVCAMITLAAGYLLSHLYMGSIAADAATVAAGISYLYWFVPGMALQFALVAMSSALRGTGIVKPAMIVQAATVILNAILAPILIAGWGTGYAMGVAGAGLASTIAIAAGVALLSAYFVRLEKYVSFHPEQWQPQLVVWRRMLKIGLPAGGEFLLIFTYIAVTYWVIRDFGAPAQAGFGIGSRVMQGIFVPALAIAFAAAPVAGQNFGAGQADRVRETFRTTAIMCSGVMLVLTLLCQWQPARLISFFSDEEAVVRIGAVFLTIISWNFALAGINMTCTSLFQALGNTVPTLLSSGTRLITYAIPSVWLASRPGFQLEQIWYLGVATVGLQTLISLALLRREIRLRLGDSRASSANA
jgi:putative MATE family efflux protein